jgi:tRNA-modifying protein YgfZ
MSSEPQASEATGTGRDISVYDRRDAGAVVVTGPDAVKFVDALVSQDVTALADGEGGHSLLLSPQGKLVVDFRVLRVGDELWCDTEPGFGSVLADGLNRFRIRVKAEVTDRSASWGRLSVRGADALANAPVTVADRPHAHVAWGDGGLRVVRADWPDGTPGYDVVGPLAALDAALETALAVLGPVRSADEYERARISAGVPAQGVDTDEKTIPQEALLERTAVSFTKGCFLGQELVCRIDSFGRVNKLLRRIGLGAPAAAGDGIEHEGRVVGVLTSVAGDLALGYVRRDVAVPAAVTVGGVPATAEALPGRPDEQLGETPVAKARIGLRR